ncbi:MAG TPA: glycosyltransferase [Terriglobales bacterium]|nr:glycosyltransferase [Terriglobales bacterium]
MESHLQQLCRSLRQYVDVTAMVSSEGSSTSREIDEGVQVLRVGTQAVIWSSPICPGMLAAIRSVPGDIVHFHHPNPAAALAYFCSRHRGKLIVSYHSDIVRQALLDSISIPLVHRLLGRAHAVVSMSPNYIETSPILRCYRERCHVIPHGIEPADFSQADHASVSEIRQRYGSRIVLAIGRLVYYKGFEFLIRAMANVEGHLLIVGTGPLRAPLEHTVQTLGIADRITFLGEVQDVVPLYHAADLFVLPSIARSEAFGIAQLEAMACGKPVINTQLDSGVPYVSLNGITGITVPPSDSQALACAINTLLDNEALRLRFGEAARRRVSEEFTVQIMTQRMLSLYQEVLCEGKADTKIGSAVTSA